MYVGFRYHHQAYPDEKMMVVSVEPPRVFDEKRGLICFQYQWTISEMKEYVDRGYWIPEESLTTVILKALKNAP